MSQVAIYLASPVAMDEAKEREFLDALRVQFCSDGGTVHRASEVFQAKFTELGSWSAYISYVATGVDFAFRLPVFSIICCVQPHLGKATAQIVGQALEAKKPVCLIHQDDPGKFSMSRVQSVAVTDDSNWKAGWSISFSSPFIHWSHHARSHARSHPGSHDCA